MKTVEWLGDRVRLIDQTRLPGELVFVDCSDWRAVAEAIAGLRVRGAPAIGVAAGYGVALAALRAPDADADRFWTEVRSAADGLRAARPTAVNLAWAVDLVISRGERGANPSAARALMLGAADALLREDQTSTRRIGQLGAALIPNGANVLTHCNTGALATVDYGTALGAVRAAFEQGKDPHVWVDETRPVLQGARLTAWELGMAGIRHTLIVDSAAGFLMKQGRVSLVIVGADRIAANGDVANKIGTYSLAALASAHGIPFYVAAPTSTVDLTVAHGDAIPIEERDPDEIRRVGAATIAPTGSPALNLAFDVTPAALVGAIVTEVGIARPPYRASLRVLAEAGARARGNLQEALASA